MKFLICWAALALAGAKETAFQVELNPEIYPPSAFQGDGMSAGRLPPRRKRADALPDRGEREAKFQKVPGLDAELSGWDELDRDLLYTRASSRSWKELRKSYPGLSEARLKRLHDLLH